MERIMLKDVLPIDSIVITNHARERFIERYKKIYNLDKVYDADYKIRSILSFAEKKAVNPKIKLMRTLNNLKNVNNNPAEYYYNAGWRMVIINNVLVTMERTVSEQN